MGDDIRPRWNDHVPFCDERCPSFDGKRCEILGRRPDNICEPAVREAIKAADDEATKRDLRDAVALLGRFVGEEELTVETAVALGMETAAFMGRVAVRLSEAGRG